MRRRHAGIMLGGVLLAPLAKGSDWRNVQLLAGELPPFTTSREGEFPGALGELVLALSRAVGGPSTLQILPWVRAQRQVQQQGRCLILPMTRTPERELQYRWMVKLYRQRFVLIAKRDSSQPLNDLDAMRSRRVVVMRGSPNALQLHAMHFTQVIEANSVEDMARMLDKSIVDAIYGGDVINLRVLAGLGLPASKLALGGELEHGDVWLAGSLDFSESDALSWRDAMERLVRDGSYARILRKYGLSSD